MKTEDYERLPEVVDSFHGVGIPGLTAKLVCRTDKKAIYFRWDGVYEVMRIQIGEACEIFGRKYPRREVYPGNEDFGMYAWCYHSEKLAREMYDRL